MQGDFAPIAGVIAASRIVAVAAKAQAAADAAARVAAEAAALAAKAQAFLDDWEPRATDDARRLFRRWKDRPDLLLKPSDWLSEVISYAVQQAQTGDRWPDVLTRIPAQQLHSMLEQRGQVVSPDALRKGLKCLGVDRPRGRPVKS
jgi:hypothetical protein